MNQLVIRNIDDARNLIKSQEQAFIARAADHKEVNFAREAGFALQALENNNFLLKIAQGNPNSLKNAITNIAAIGLSLNPAEKSAYLVPMNKMVNLVVSYMGLVRLATKSGAIEWVKAEIVKEKDSFEVQSMGRPPVHDYNPFSDRGEMIGCYSVAKLSTGDFLVETMSKDEIDKIRAKSKSANNGPWVTDYFEMAKKTVIKRAAKLFPAAKDKRLLEAIEISNQAEGIDFEEQEKIAQEKIKAKNETAKVDYNIKEGLIFNISKMCGDITENMQLQEKGQFIVEVLGVNKFDDLKRKSINELNELIEKLDDMRVN